MFRARRVTRRRTKTAQRGADAGRQEREHTGEKRDAAPAPAPVVDPIEQIKDLDELRGQGILTEEEFTAEKKRLLGI